MTSEAVETELLLSYQQSDAGSRAGLFPAFLSNLKSLSRGGEVEEAAAWARRAVSLDLDYSSLVSLKKLLAVGHSAQRKKAVRLAVLGGPTTIQLVELLRIFLEGAGVAADIYEAEYGLFRQEVLTPGSGLDRFQPQIVFVATSSRDVARFPDAAMSDGGVEQLAQDELADWLRLWEVVHSRWGASVIQNSFDISPWRVMGHFSLRHKASRESFLEQMNHRFAANAPPYVAFHDIGSLTLEYGAREWFDPRFYLEAKMPCGPQCLVPYAHSVASIVMAISGKSRKVLVLDLDNTLWGGVVGDVGVEGIQLGQGSGEGEAFLQFQQYAKSLRERGILLAVCSKNEDHFARQPFEQRPDMVLKLSDFSCFLANWRNKADNLREIAERLELGIDSFVFADDNPAERALVRRLVPEVAVPDMPPDPAGYVQAVARHRFFETVSWTKEDASRAQYYELNARRKEIAAEATDLDSFLASLDMKARVEPVNRLNIERVTQLVNKSNQFNLTTRRRTVAEVDAIGSNPDWITLTISLNDKLGDNGLISILFSRKEGNTHVIDTWVMSCRVLQRGVEQLALNELVARCRAHGCSELKGVYIPTERNGMVRELLSSLGFAAAGNDGDTTLWTLSVRDQYSPWSTHIQVEKPDGQPS
ncbi:MAG: HAD-IIIC family phosphatase [Acidobacteria bacterium]|nr:HAD-IIIC family phosphatase [Acidobacteriota bacterium]